MAPTSQSKEAESCADALGMDYADNGYTMVEAHEQNIESEQSSQVPENEQNMLEFGGEVT